MIKILYIGNNLTHKSKYNSTFSTLSNLLEKEEFQVIRTSSQQNKILRLLDMLFQLLKNHKKIDFVLIDTYSTSNFYYAFITSQLARILNKKFIPILHGGNLPQRLDQSPSLSKLIFKKSFQNVAPSGYLKYEFEKRSYNTTFIPNVLNIDEYQFTKREEIKPRLLWVRAFAEFYNPTMAVKLLKELKSIFPEAVLCMVGPDKGDGSFQATQQLIQELQLTDSVTLTGVLPKEQWHLLSIDYDLFINTTTIDNTPVSVMEAMALGLPIVSTEVGGVPYLVEKNEDGLLVPNDDVAAMKEAVVKLILNPQIVKQITVNARKKAETFDWSQVKNKWLSLLKK